jgi:peptidoglycan-associated lipoprotein
MMNMKLLTAALLIGHVLSACSDQGQFGARSGDPANGTSGYGQLDGGVENSIGYFQNSIGDRIFFPVDRSNLTQQAQSLLDSQASWLIENAASEVLIEGHADERGTREYNLALGARRASAVLNYLVSRGVSADRLQIISFGKERPLEVCSQEICYSKNRRAVTVISSALTG